MSVITECKDLRNLLTLKSLNATQRKDVSYLPDELFFYEFILLLNLMVATHNGYPDSTLFLLDV